MLTLPSEVSTNKDNVSYQPILLVDFIEIPYHIGSRYIQIRTSFTKSDGAYSGSYEFDSATATFQDWGVAPGDGIYINGDGYYEVASVSSQIKVILTTAPDPDTGLTYYVVKAFNDLLLQKSKVTCNTSLPQLVNSVGSMGSITLTVVDWRGALRSGIVGSSPDLTGSTVYVYLKFGTTGDYSTDLLSNAIQFFTGIVSTYNIHDDKITFSLVAELPALADIPQTLVANKAEIAVPLHYGNFSEGVNSFRQPGAADGLTMARCPLEFWDAEAQMARYQIADHQMDTLPTDSEIDSNTVSLGGVVRDNKYVSLKAATGGSTAFTNGAGGAYVDVDVSTKECYLWLRPQEVDVTDNSQNPDNAKDGDGTTYAVVDDSGDYPLSLKTLNADDLSENQLDPGSLSIRMMVFLGTVTGTSSFYIRTTDGTYTSQALISSSDSDTWVDVAVPVQCVSWSDLELYLFQVVPNGSGNTCQVRDVIIRARVQDLSIDDEYLYLICRGREFSGTWNSRKTSGNEIVYAPEMVESLLRDEWGYGDDEIDMDAFDVVNDYFKLVIYVVLRAGSIVEQKKAYTWLEQICQAWNFSLYYNVNDNKWKLKYPLAACNDFSSSGTGTPGVEDIFADDAVLAGEVYTYHPIKRGSFKLLRTDLSEKYGKLTIKYDNTHQGFRRSTSVGSGKEYTIDNFMQGSDGIAVYQRNNIDDWILNQKWICEFETFYNAISHEIGDVINIRHDDLNDDMLPATVNTQKWMIIGFKLQWRPGIIQITALALI